MKTRREKILAHIRPKETTGLEIGPLCWPVVTKTEGDMWYADHASTEELKRLYKNDPSVPKDQIVPIDFALAGRSLPQVVGTKRFDYVIASHVIEHVPDMIAWLADIASVLKPGGVLSLAIPDKRYTFDIDRNVSRVADILGAHLDKHTRPDSATVFDYAYNYRSKIDAQNVWNGKLYLSTSHAPRRYTVAEALAQCKANSGGQYVDVHVQVFTPASFFAVVRELIPLELFDFTLESFFDTAPGEYEFFVTLRKKDNGTTVKTQLRSIPRMAVAKPVRALEAEIATLKQELADQAAQYEQTVQALLNSHSWRVTKPLRAVGAKLGTLRKR